MSGRRLRDWAFWGLCGLAMLGSAAPAVSVLVSVVHQAAPVLDWSLLTRRSNAGGIENAVLGTLWLLLGVLVLAGSIGIGAGVYLAELATGRVARVLRFGSEVLAGMPSIVIGYIGYVTMVVGLHWGYSYLAGVIALSVLVLPYIVKTTEVALRQVPSALREGAVGLGMAHRQVIWRILLPPAAPAVVSGVVVALAISTGELAPLLFTVGFTDSNPSLAPLHQQVPYLTSVTFTDLSLPGARAHATAAAAGAASLAILVLLILLGRALSRRSRLATAQMTL